MNIFKSSRLVTRSLIGAVGLSVGAIALLGVPDAAKADIPSGTDYLSSPAGSNFFDFPGIGLIQLEGLPFGPGNTDTTVKRGECIFVAGSCEIDIEMTMLSLTSVDPVEINGDLFDLFVSITPNEQSSGTMTINENGTFMSELDVPFDALFAPVGTGQENASCPLGQGQCSFVNTLIANGQWGPTPESGTIIVMGELDDMDANVHKNLPLGDTDFFILGDVEHLHKDFAASHTVRQAKTPEPSVTLALALFGLAGTWGLKKQQSLK